MKKLYTSLQVATGAACLWEAVTIGLRLAGMHNSPTISREVGVYWWLGAPILGGLAVHLYWPQVVRLVTWLRSLRQS